MKDKATKFSEALLHSLVILVIALSFREVNLSVYAAAAISSSINEPKIDNVHEYLATINAKLDIINGAIVNEKRSCSSLKPIMEEKFRLIEQRLEQLNRKYDELINQNIDNIDKTQKSDLNFDGVPQQQTNLDDFRNRFSTTKSETTKIEHLHQRPTQNLTSRNNNNNNLETKAVQQQRRSRDSRKNVNFINELLKMVNDRLSSEKEVESTSSSMTDILSSTENSNSLVTKPTRRRNTAMNRKSGGIVFPNIKNRLAMMNATSNFISSIKRETYVCERLIMKKFHNFYYQTVKPKMETSV